VDSEKPEDPIEIPEDTREDPESVLNMEQQILQYKPSDTNHLRFSEHSYFGNREDVSLALNRLAVAEEPEPEPQPIRIPNIGCKNCTAYYKILRKTCSSPEALKRLKCAHKRVRPATPEGFWNVGFTPSEQENP
jgi:hypothetical protein